MITDDIPQPSWLFILPATSSEITLSSLRVAYGPGLSQCLQHASKVSARASDVALDVAIAYNDVSNFSYSRVQVLLGLMYKLTCIICTEQHIDLQYDNDVDIRITFFRDGEEATHPENVTFQKSVIDLQALAKINRVWQRLCSLESEIGETLLRKFLRSKKDSSQYVIAESQIERFPGGVTMLQQPPSQPKAESNAFHRHHSVAVGGTFDHLHAGHKLLLTMTALVLDPEPSPGWCIAVGITGDELLKNKQYREVLESFEQRLSAVRHFLLDILELISPTHTLQSTSKVESSGPHGRTVHDVLKSGLNVKYVEIFDPCGPTLTEESITGLVLSGETRKGGEFVNEKRNEKGWHALEVFEVDVLDTEEGEAGNQSQIDDEYQSKISSTDIRRRVLQKSKADQGN